LYTVVKHCWTFLRQYICKIFLKNRDENYAKCSGQILKYQESGKELDLIAIFLFIVVTIYKRNCTYRSSTVPSLCNILLPMFDFRSVDVEHTDVDWCPKCMHIWHLCKPSSSLTGRGQDSQDIHKLSFKQEIK